MSSSSEQQQQPMNVNLFVTCVSKDPPSLPLNEEVNTLGVEAILLPSSNDDGTNTTNHHDNDKRMKSDQRALSRSQSHSIKALAAMMEQPSKPKRSSKTQNAKQRSERASTTRAEDDVPKTISPHQTVTNSRSRSRGRGFFRKREADDKSRASVSFGRRLARSLSPRRRNSSGEEASRPVLPRRKQSSSSASVDSASSSKGSVSKSRERDSSRVYESLVSKYNGSISERPPLVQEDGVIVVGVSTPSKEPASVAPRSLCLEEEVFNKSINAEKESPQTDNDESKHHRSLRKLQRKWRHYVQHLRTKKQTESESASLSIKSSVSHEITPIEEEEDQESETSKPVEEEDQESETSSAYSSVPPSEDLVSSSRLDQQTPPRLQKLILADRSEELGETSDAEESGHSKEVSPTTNSTQKELSIAPDPSALRTSQTRELKIQQTPGKNDIATKKSISRAVLVTSAALLLFVVSFLVGLVMSGNSKEFLDRTVFNNIVTRRPIYRQQTRRSRDRPTLHRSAKKSFFK